MSIDSIIAAHVVIGILVWCVVYISDFVLTMIGAQLHHRYISQYIDFGGSYELNPTFQNDVDQRRWISPRFLLLLAMTTGYLILSAVVLPAGTVFTFLLGLLLLMEVPVHFHHIQNIRLGLMLRQDKTLLGGHILYKRVLSYRLMALDFLFFGSLWLILALLMGSFFFLGGVLGSLITALRFYTFGTRIQRAEEARPQSSTPTEST